MPHRESSGSQFADVAEAVIATPLALLFVGVGVTSLLKEEWSVGVVGIIMGLGFGFRAFISVRSFRRSMRADREFEAQHKGGLDWKGDPIDPGAS